MATLKRVTSYMCGECGEKIMAIRHRCPKCKVAFNNVENFTYAQQPQERHCPPHDLEDKDDHFVCRICKKSFPAEDVVGD